ncbi:40S ribosomal protein S12 [Datura stramonium]|uniref:40S ribosomal protein S12 n=1 Tax=Datura stramonium TaxID=4076 RepID=A0ABS8SJH5_DATST|nr:40S ribosomal protein S12 [Datura stramonium]
MESVIDSIYLTEFRVRLLETTGLLGFVGLTFTNKKMSGEDAAVAVPVAETPAPPLGEPMDIMTALQLLCVLAEDCDQPDYVKLVKALCADHNVSLITVPNAKTLGEDGLGEGKGYQGIMIDTPQNELCRLILKVKQKGRFVGCGCVVVKDYGEETEGLHIVQEAGDFDTSIAFLDDIISKSSTPKLNTSFFVLNLLGLVYAGSKHLIKGTDWHVLHDEKSFTLGRLVGVTRSKKVNDERVFGQRR